VKKSSLALIILIGISLLVLLIRRSGEKPLRPGVKADRIVVEKQVHRLTLLRDGQPLKSYAVALGRAAGPKERRGDCRTPEGKYVIDGRNTRSRYYRSLHVSYPNAAERRRARKRGWPPGGDIMIHGLPPKWAWVGRWHSLLDWTQGCIAVSNGEMDELSRAVPLHTPIEIKP
jgi:murein L,D-transpeptidase YafK